MTMPIAFRVNDRVKTLRAALAHAPAKQRDLPVGIEDALRLWEAAQALPTNRGSNHEREVIDELLSTATADTLNDELVQAELTLRLADAADRLRVAGMLDALAARVDQAITAGLSEIHNRLAPALLDHAKTLAAVAPKLPTGDPFDPAAVLAADAGAEFQTARRVCVTLLAISTPFAPIPGTATEVPRRAQPLIPLVDVGTVVPQTYVSLGQQDDRGNTAQEAAHFKAVRQMHTDAEDRGPEVAIVRAAAGAYGSGVTLALVRPDDMQNRMRQHVNAELIRRGQVDRSHMMVLR